jgi:hypothetical protein
MIDLNFEDLMEKALNSPTNEVFKHEWNLIDDNKKGELKMFFLMAQNCNKIIDDENIKMNIYVYFGTQ